MNDNEQLTAALGRVSSGIYILTLGQEENATGMLASWVMQAGFDPPMVTVAVKQERYISDRLTEGEPFILNVVGEGQTDLLKHFGKGFEPGEPAFEGLAISHGENGVPRLESAIATLECLPEGQVDSDDHRVFLAEVTAGSLLAETPPMTHLRNRGDRY